MSESPSPPPSLPAQAESTSPLLIIIGILFILGWLSVAAVVATMSLLGTLMANDSGKMNSDTHGLILLTVLGGQILTALAGISAGLAFPWRSKRKTLLLTFSLLLISGIASILIGIATLDSAMSAISSVKN